MRRSLLIAMTLLCWLVPASVAAAVTLSGNDDSDDLVVVVGSVVVDRDDTVGDVVIVDGDLTVRGTVEGDVVVVDGDVTIRGRVTGDVVTVAGQATLGRRARVGGDLVYGDEKPVQTPGSRVGGDVEKVDIGDASILAAIGAWIAVAVSMFLLGLLLILLAPRAADAVARTAKERAPIVALVGFLAFFLIPLIAILAFFTLLGIPLGVVLLLAIVPLYAIAFVATAYVIGRLILKTSPRVLSFLVGLAILMALMLIPILGPIVVFVAIVFGLGALLVAARDARRATA